MARQNDSSGRPSARALALAAAVALTAVDAGAGALITRLEDPGPRLAAAAGDASLQALVENPATAEIFFVDADPKAVAVEAEAVALELPDLDLEARRIESYLTESGSLLWTGVILAPGAKELEFDPLDTLTLVVNGGRITGNVRYQGAWYQIRPLTSGGHVVVTVDLSRVPADDPPDFALLPVLPALIQGVEDADAVGDTVITVLVNYSPAAASASGDINGLIDLAMAEANQAYDQSGVQIDLVLAKRSRVTYTESNNSLTDLNRYQGTSDGFMDYIHTQRTQYGADVGILLLASLEPGIAGRATNIGSSAATAFAVVHQGFATGNYTFAHEIGHLQSARHDPAADPSTSPYPYGHGYVFTGSPRWRTIMATVQAISTPRINYFSNPNRLYNGVPMGTAATHDNTRVLNNTRGTIAGFRSVPNCVPDGGFDDTLFQTSCCSGYAVGGSTYCTNPADWGTTWASCTHICGTRPVNGCIISGGIDDTLLRTHCCSGAAVPGSTFCNDPADFGTDWTTCAQVCQ